MSVSAFGLFCEDVREEKGETTTLVGVFPASVNLPAFPSGLPKLGVYCMLHFPVEESDFTAEVKLRATWGFEVSVGKIGQDLLQLARAEAKTQELASGSILFKGILAPMPVPSPGRIEMIAVIDGVESVCGIVRFIAPGPSVS
jgi:hypothetical protein